MRPLRLSLCGWSAKKYSGEAQLAGGLIGKKKDCVGGGEGRGEIPGTGKRSHVTMTQHRGFFGIFLYTKYTFTPFALLE